MQCDKKKKIKIIGETFKIKNTCISLLYQINDTISGIVT